MGWHRNTSTNKKRNILLNLKRLAELKASRKTSERMEGQSEEIASGQPSLDWAVLLAMRLARCLASSECCRDLELLFPLA
jgi:hypothetical protein